MSSKLTFMSWNCRGIMSSVPYLVECLKNHDVDICALQEHWLRRHCVNVLESIDSTYSSVNPKCVDDSYPEAFKIRMEGGVTFIVKSSIVKYVESIDIEDTRITGIEIHTIHSENIYCFCVYLPASSKPFEHFRIYVERLYDIYMIYSQLGTVIILGDINAKVNGPRSFNSVRDKRSVTFAKFLDELRLVSLHLQSFGEGNTFTFQSYESGPSTAIDHILISKDNISLIDSARVLDDHSFNVSDHHPIIAKLILDNTVIADTETIIKQSKVSWNKAREKNNLEDFSFATSQHLWGVEIPSLGCSNCDIECYYSNIVDAIQQAETETLPHKTFVKYLKPYWTHHVNALHENMASKRQQWISCNRPRGEHVIFQEYKSAKRNFRRELRNAYQKHMQETYNSLEKDFDIDQKRLWSFLNKNKKSKSCLSRLIVNGRQCSTQDDILDGWAEHFESIFKQNTESEPVSDKERAITKTVEVAHKDFRGTFYNNTKLNITVNEVEKVLKCLKNNKASGLDNIEYEHLKYGGNSLRNHMTKLFNLVCYNFYSPKSWKSSLIVPLFKGGKNVKVIQTHIEE
ncbi:unnamed protein product [Mytilus edulis]|uniref:Endonuclease/exonuclease/phosphatase domain-containing protein n=1 Tax=Mytilus edulis TaxID=6550 RepID=A0A8S3QEC4_MYTED|nr:unnamed protein product [Mytilus edulis]